MLSSLSIRKSIYIVRIDNDMNIDFCLNFDIINKLIINLRPVQMKKRNQRWQAVAVKQTINVRNRKNKPTKIDKQLKLIMWLTIIVGLLLIVRGIYLSTAFDVNPNMDTIIPFLLVFFGFVSLSIGCDSATDVLLSKFKVKQPYMLQGWKRFLYELCWHISMPSKIVYGLIKKIKERKRSK